jgi:predicted RNA binding protein YcfA (HicA-like mRNA interferase family)
MDFHRFISILEAQGFALARQRGSHRTHRGVVDGKVRIVIVACHRESDDT